GASTAIPPSRRFPFWFVSMGGGYKPGTVSVGFVNDPEMPSPVVKAKAIGHITTQGFAIGCVGAYEMQNTNNGYSARPFVYIAERSPSPGIESAWAPATAQAILNDEGSVVRVVH